MFQALVLLLIANGTPVLADRLMGKCCNWPLDAHVIASDGNPLLGKSKTLRGLLLSLLLTAIAAVVLGHSWQLGLMFGVLSMSGDIVSSFTKRRLGMPPSSKAPGLDQVPEALLPLTLCATELELQWQEVLLLTGIFWLLEVLLSRILFTLHIRKQPW